MFVDAIATLKMLRNIVIYVQWLNVLAESRKHLRTAES